LEESLKNKIKNSPPLASKEEKDGGSEVDHDFILAKK